MPNIKISELPSANTIQGSETVQVIQGGENKKTTVNDIRPIVDQTYSSTSANPQSGIAVAEAISNKQDKFATVYPTSGGNTVVMTGHTGFAASNQNDNFTFLSNIDMLDKKITSLATPTASNDAANKAYVDTKQDKFATVTSSQTVTSVDFLNDIALQSKLDSTTTRQSRIVVTPDGLTLHGGSYISLGNEKLQNVATPTNISDAATKGYVDDSINAAANKQYEQITRGITETSGTYIFINFSTPLKKLKLLVNAEGKYSGSSQGYGGIWLNLPAAQAWNYNNFYNQCAYINPINNSRLEYRADCSHGMVDAVCFYGNTDIGQMSKAAGCNLPVNAQTGLINVNPLIMNTITSITIGTNGSFLFSAGVEYIVYGIKA